MIRGLTKNVYCAYTYRRSGQFLVMVPSSRGNIFTVAFIVPPPSSCHGTQTQHQRMQPHSYVILPTPNNQENKQKTKHTPLCTRHFFTPSLFWTKTKKIGKTCLYHTIWGWMPFYLFFILWYLINKNRQPFSVQVNCDHTGTKLKKFAHHKTTNI